MAPPATNNQVSILFVCLGNICRSPMAEGTFQALLEAHPHPQITHIDSCGTGAYHVGDPPDPRTLKVLRDNNITTYKHAARKLRAPEDFKAFDYVLGMDESNAEDLLEVRDRCVKRGVLKEEECAVVGLYGSVAGYEGEVVGDPYYGGAKGFTKAYEQLTRFGKGLMKRIEEGKAE
ncbi:hypothetical protein MBLNU230_g3999t1 [Neophaeotheca triangularis]